MREKNAFTLLEMMIVLLIITVILLISLNGLTQKQKIIREKGCDALLSVIDSQIVLYQIENDTLPSMSDLIQNGYLKKEQAQCPDGSAVEIVNGQAIRR